MYDNEIEDIDAGSFDSFSNLKLLYLYNNKLREIDRICFEPLNSIELILLYENDGLKALSFVKPLTSKYTYDEEKLNEYGSISDWNQFLQQFPELGNSKINKYIDFCSYFLSGHPIPTFSFSNKRFSLYLKFLKVWSRTVYN